MREYVLKIKENNSKTKLKFELDCFLTQTQSFQFKHEDECKHAPLAKRLFAFDNVVMVYIAQNFIVVEKAQPIRNSDFKTALHKTIDKHIESGAPIFSSEAKGQRIPVNIYTEMTPSPGVLKFVCNIKLAIYKVEVNYNESAEQYPLIEELFKFSYIKRVVLDDNHILLTKGGDVIWEEVVAEIRDFIRVYLMKGNPVAKK